MEVVNYDWWLLLVSQLTISQSAYSASQLP